jgi:hypothetical protein
MGDQIKYDYINQLKSVVKKKTKRSSVKVTPTQVKKIGKKVHMDIVEEFKFRKCKQGTDEREGVWNKYRSHKFLNDKFYFEFIIYDNLKYSSKIHFYYYNPNPGNYGKKNNSISTSLRWDEWIEKLLYYLENNFSEWSMNMIDDKTQNLILNSLMFNQTCENLKNNWSSIEQGIKKEKIKRKKEFKNEVSNILDEFDSDKDGIIDFNQGKDDFMNLLKKHQVSIIEIDQNHITKFIQVSNYLKTKRENIQKQFEKIKTSKNNSQMNEYIGVLKNQIDTFNLISYNSMIMIISLVEKDLITFNEIYLTFDKLNIFNSNWENEISKKLEDIGSKLDDLIFSINKMEESIVSEIFKMSLMNEFQMNRLNKTVSQGSMKINDSLKVLNSSLSSNLKSIGSKLNLNNLLTGINTYQLYTLNKNTKSLRS